MALLLEVPRDRETDILRFARDLKVPPTSNQAERDLRPAKIQQNTSGRLTSERRTQDRYNIRGYLSTAAKHGHNMMTAMRQAITGQRWMPPRPHLTTAAPPSTDEQEPDRSSPHVIGTRRRVPRLNAYGDWAGVSRPEG